MRTGYFDNDGKCLVIQTGAMEPPASFAYSAEVPDTLGPNTVEYDKQSGKVKAKQKAPKPDNPPAEDLRKLIDDLEKRVAALEKKA